MLRTLLEILLIYLIIRAIARMVFPLIVKSAAEKVNEQFKQTQYKDNRAEGEVRIDKMPETKTSDKVKDGEYTDFTEVK